MSLPLVVVKNWIRAIRPAAGLAALAAMVIAAPVHAAVPTTAAVEGVLLSRAGAPAADGEYDLTFSIYAAEGAKTAAWSEGPVKVTVASGRFSYAMGTSKALDGKILAGLSSAWLGVQVGSDPELPRKPLHSVAYALVAAHAMTADAVGCTGCIKANQLANGGISASKLGFNYAGSSTKGGPALDLACTGCVSAAEMKFDGDIDLGGNSIKAKNGTFSGDVAAKSVTATSFVGDGSKLTGIKTPAGTCSKPGEVVKGIKADGSLVCVAALDPTALPKDGLNEISNDLLTNQYVDTISADSKDIAIPDNTGAEGISNITFPDIGVAQTFELTINVKNTDFSKAAITLLPPDDKKVGYVLCDPCAKDDSIKQLTLTYPKTAPKSGDLTTWIGKNPKGVWNLKVKDTEFCVPQKPGNAALCDVTKKTDGVIVNWSIKIQTLSNQKVAVNANLLANKDLHVGGAIKIASTTGTCDAKHKGELRWTGGKGLVACDGAAWVMAKARPVVYQGYCSLDRRYTSSWNWYCLNKTTVNTAGDYLDISTYAPPSGTTSNGYDAEWHDGSNNSKKIGRITVKIAGWYRVRWHVRTQPYTQWDSAIYVNGSAVDYAQEIDDNSYNDMTRDHEKLVQLKVGDRIEFRSDTNTDNSSSYVWFAGPTNSFVEVEYVGSNAF
ncbi:MAG: hypothetical protein H6747_02040 [Deltaproteobacteria bacterium]|nr:hypothetical protein [Deltaproteobacteria bacterium]